jgi:8-amino-3,8-dideoxy-alpha-D-manno-octulosonate transaminase
MPGYELYDDIERKELMDVIQSGVFMRYGFDGARGGHWKAKELEAAICERFGTPYAQLTSSGTTALHTTFAALGIGAGDEIIVPTFTFVASFEAILMAGAIPVLTDINETLCLDPKAVEKNITPRTKAVMPVHMCGSMADLEALQSICKSHNLLLIEDACQAIGATYHGKCLGSIGDAGCFSFDFVKTMTCGEGGVVMTPHADVYQRADQFQDHGHDHIGNDRGAELHPYMGLNYRISELHAALGLGQIKKLDHFLALQRRNKKILADALKAIPQVTFRSIPDPEGDSATFLSFFLPDATTARAAAQAIKAAGIDGTFYYFDNNWHYIRNWHHLKQRKTMMPLSPGILSQMPDYSKADFSVSDHVISRNISLAIKIGWTEDELKQRAEKLYTAVSSVL